MIGVTELVDILEASEATVRRDINDLAAQGLLRRIRGGAESLTPHHHAHLVGMPFNLSQGIGAPQKLAIGRAAVQLLVDADSIIINGGTTTYAMAECMVEDRIERPLDILTNSIPILAKLQGVSRYRITVTGGTFYREQNIVLSPHGDDVIEHFCAQRLFTGCNGLSRFGLMEADPLVARAQMKLLDRAEELIVLADSRKFRQRSSMTVAPLERIHTVITDTGVTEAELEPLRKAGIQIITVEIAVDERKEGARGY